MRGTFLLVFKSYFGQLLSTASVIACASTIVSTLAVYAQLPPTNMGQFVHQPGDNQYTNQTQAERHGASIAPVAVPAQPVSNVSANNGGYQITPPAPKPDISLLPVVADEPIKPAGFPPLPDRLDLPSSGAGVWAGAGMQRAVNGNSGQILPDGINRNPTGVHQHYVHYDPGAFMPNQAAPAQPNYRPSSTDYYNVNPSARGAAPSIPVAATAPVAVDTPSTRALRGLGREPKLGIDEVTRPEAPVAVTVNQSVSQDLSLPEDDFNKHYPTNTQNSTASRTSRGIGQAIGFPLRQLGYTAVGVASYGAIYALHR